MIGTQLVREFVSAVLLTGRVMDANNEESSPVSVFLIASPEHGKTSIVLETPFPNAVDVSDATGKGIQEILKHSPEVSHIIFNDLTALNAHGKNVRAYTMSMINAMTEEGIRSLAFPGQVEIFKNGKRGIIGCIVPSMIKDRRNWWNKMGLTSRVLPFGYSYSGRQVLDIKASIDMEVKHKKPNEILIPKELIRVDIKDKETAVIRAIADEKAKELGDDTGIRRLKQFRRLARGSALLRNPKNTVVNQLDIEFLQRIFPYISYSTTPEL